MKKLLILILISAVLAVLTCPQKKAHKDALMTLVDTAIDAELNKDAETEVEKGFAMLSSWLGSGIAEIVLDKKLEVENYFVCSIGRIRFDGKDNIVSVGIFNHVFTKDKDELKEELNLE